MGKKNFRGRNYKGNKRDGNKTDDWKEIDKENEKWESFYKAQKIIESEEEFEKFKQYCKDSLPLTFRITGSKDHANEILKIFKDRHLNHLQNLQFEGKPVKEPKPISFYPNDLAWQIDVSKTVMRKDENFAKTQRFLVVETEVGNISRQEAVSMIPPILLDVQSHHKVLDMCAAPGSKTAQLIEALHQTENPTGFVVANDSDFKRAHMLVHQIKRLNSPNMIVVNHDAQFFPKTKINDEFVKFDRILCDVPCSGDGTIRKNAQIWNKWSIGDGLGLNPLQYKILQRGIDLLEKGGRLVYSTCSLNPMENESVIAHALRKNKDVKIVKYELPGLIHSKGLNDWKVFAKDGTIKNKGDEGFGDELFPPTEEEIKEFGLENCIRVYPQQQNTGGFFITLLEKINTEEDKVEEPSKKKAKFENPIKKEKLATSTKDGVEPFTFLPRDHEELKKCWDFYGFNIDDTDFTESCFVRNASGDPTRIIYLSTPLVKQFLTHNEEKLKIVHSGVKIFVSQRTDLECSWRIQSEAIPIVKKIFTDENKRILKCSLELFEKLLKEAFPKFDELESSKIDDAFTNKIKSMSQGCAFVKVSRDVTEDQEELIYPVWIGSKCVNLMLSKKETFEVLYRVFNVETTGQEAYKQTPNGPGEAITGTNSEKLESTPGEIETSVAEVVESGETK
ncbi:hypothetical protein WICMUC_002168 [Wickerhamomyces mucosus]|uniref:SAM-dependent MTase RsmB/NOP-type domain-containing protein n=1 Tax=Wickerhamomyces mucosus TaxID=1378264 RepID=A0A9P8TF73_9ASCO|nr:hypothetical protein WICMUC_002168 [Wickerhamomyces mucosus]